MVYLSDKGSENEDMKTRKSHQDGGSSSETESQIRKTCADCGTSKTPLWRGGPAGPKSLCNACGIRSRKKRRALLGSTKPNDQKSKKGNSTSSSSISNNSGITTKNSNGKNTSNKSIGDSLKRRLMMALGKEVLLQRSSMEKLRKKLGEEEQAAVLLMALSCGSVFA